MKPLRPKQSGGSKVPVTKSEPSLESFAQGGRPPALLLLRSSRKAGNCNHGVGTAGPEFRLILCWKHGPLQAHLVLNNSAGR